MANRVYEYEDQDGNLYWSFRKPERSTFVGLRLSHRGRLGLHPYHFIRKMQVIIRDAIFQSQQMESDNE